MVLLVESTAEVMSMPVRLYWKEPLTVRSPPMTTSMPTPRPPSMMKEAELVSSALVRSVEWKVGAVTFLANPAPPATTSAPELVLVESVASVRVTMPTAVVVPRY